LRLVAGDESDIPRNLHNIVVSIHAIATFQALHDYLRPRVAGLLGSGSRLSGMFAALAASGFVGSSSSKASGDGTVASSAKSNPAAESSSGTATSSSPTVQRRRSQRLAKQGTSTTPSADHLMDADDSSTSGKNPATSDAATSPSSEPTTNQSIATEPAPGDALVEPELHADFSDEDDLDAEVFDDEVDSENAVADKTINLSVAEGLFFSSYLLLFGGLKYDIVIL